MFAGAAFTDSADIKVDTEVVDTLVSLGVVNGYDDGSFKPNGTVTRAEMAKMIYVLRTGNSDASAYNDDKTSFTDIGSHWARGYIKYCQSLGIIAGKSNTKFVPNEKVSAQEAAKMLLVTLGYNAQKAGLVGTGWASKTNALADENGLLEDVNTSFTSACPRQYAAQLIYNAIDAKTVVLRDGEYTDETAMGHPNKTVGEKYMGLNTAKGVVTAVDHNNKGYTMTVTTAYKANPFTDGAADKTEVTLTSIDFDPTDFVGSYVKAMYKKTDKVYGVSVDSKQTCVSVVTDLGDIDLNKDEYKLDGVTYKTDKTKATDFGAIKVVDTLGAKLGSSINTLDDVTAVSDASDVALIDYDGDEKIDVAVVTPVVFGKLTYIGSSKLTVNGGVLSNVDKDDCVLYDGAAKDDYVAVVKDTYVADDKNVITKLDKASGKVEAKKDTDKFRVDGTWYTKLVTRAYTVGTTDGDYYIYNGYIVLDDAKSGSIADTAYVVQVGNTIDVEGNYQAKVMVNGETKIVSAEANTTDSTIAAGAKDTYCTYEIDDGVYQFKPITSSNVPTDFTYGTVQAYKDKKLYQTLSSGTPATVSGTSYILDADAVVYVKYKDDKYSILTGKDVAGWGDKVKAATGTVLTKTEDGLTVVKGAALDLGSAAVPASTATYGVITSDIVSAKDNKAEFTIWNGTEYIDVVTKSTVSGLHKFDLVEYQANTDDTYDITLKKAASTKKAIVGYSKTSGDIKFADATNASGRVSKIVTDDTQVIFVNTDKDVDAKDAGINGEEIAVSDEPVSGTYNTNVIWYDDDDSDTDLTVLVIDTVNTEYAAS